MRELVIDASKKLESGDTLMMLMVAKARFFQNDEGAIYTSIRPEEGAIIGPSRYRQWLYEVCKQTLTRISNHQKAYSCEANAEAYAESGIEREWINGLLLSRGHYEMVDIEQYKFNLLRALDIIENRPIEDSPQPVLKLSTDEQDQDGDASSSANGEDSLRETVLSLLIHLTKEKELILMRFYQMLPQEASLEMLQKRCLMSFQRKVFFTSQDLDGLNEHNNVPNIQYLLHESVNREKTWQEWNFLFVRQQGLQVQIG